MRLKDAARRFNDTLATDAYTGDEAFFCAFTSYDDHAASGATARRRVLSVPEGTEIPLRSAINLYGEIWIVGAGSADAFGGSIARVAYNMKKATDLAKVGTPAQALSGTGATLAFVQKQYFKDIFNTVSESDSSVAWNVFLSPHETIDAGSIIVTPDVKLRVRMTYLPVDGLRVAECDEMPTNTLQTAVFTENGTYNSATDSYATVSITTPVFIVDYNKLYQLHTASDAPYVQGDEAVLVPKTALTPKVGSLFTMLGTTWRVLTVQSELDCWLLHVRVG